MSHIWVPKFKILEGEIAQPPKKLRGFFTHIYSIANSTHGGLAWCPSFVRCGLQSTRELKVDKLQP